MERIFTNLLDNALKYSAPVENAIIEVEGCLENGEAVYIVIPRRTVDWDTS
jgi:signal transduction histidine kinase